MIKATQILFWFCLSIAASLALYHTSDRTHELERQLRSINSAIDAEQQSLHVLRAEWVYLTNPARIEVEAKKHLAGMNSPATNKVASLADLGDLLPDQNAETASVTSTPIASVGQSMPAPVPAAYTPPEKPKLATASKVKKVATVDRSHINSRMMIGHPQKTASAQTTDPIGSYIRDLRSSRP